MAKYEITFIVETDDKNAFKKLDEHFDYLCELVNDSLLDPLNLDGAWVEPAKIEKVKE